MPHRPQTTDGTTASRSITYTMGRDQRRGTTSVSSSAMPMLTGTEMTSAITELMTVPYRKAIAPKWLVAGSQSVEKMPLSPAVAEPGRRLLCRRDGDEDEDDEHQQAGGERQDLESPVAERPAVRERAGGPGRGGRVRLSHGAHEVSVARAT